MKKLIQFSATAALLTAISLASFAADATKLEGKWSTKKNGPDGNPVTQVIEITKDKFKFKILKGSDDVVLYAEGSIKTETSGPFSIVKFIDIKAGASESDTQSTGDDRSTVYVISDDTLTLAGNFDKERDNEKPSLDVYTKAKK